MKDRFKMIRKSVFDENGKTYSQDKFAKIMNVTRDMIATYETGKVMPSNLYIKSLCDKFNVNETWLRTGEGEMFAPLDREQEIAQITAKLFHSDDEFLYRLVNYICQLNETQMQIVKQIIQELAEIEKSASQGSAPSITDE